MYPSEREPAGSDTDKTNAGTTTGNPKASADQTQVNKPSVFVAPPLENQNPVKESEKKDDASQKEGPPKVDSKQKESPVTDTPLETNKEMMKDPKGEKENKKDKKTEEEEQKKEKDKEEKPKEEKKDEKEKKEDAGGKKDKLSVSVSGTGKKKPKKKKETDSKEALEREAKHKKRLNHIPPKPEQIYAELPKKRTFWGWFVAPVYILTIWGMLAAMMAPIMFFIPEIYKGGPENVGDGSFLGRVPKLIFEPNVARLGIAKSDNHEVEERKRHPSEIHYINRLPRTYEPYLTRLRFLLTDEYGPERFTQCFGDTEHQRAGCLVDLSNENYELGYGACAVAQGQTVQSFSFGFEDQQPCIIVRQNKMLHYMPNLVDIRNMTKDLRILGEVQTLCNREHYNESLEGDCCFFKRSLLKCETDNGVVQIFPSMGVPACHFPYKSSANDDDVNSYQQPIHFVRVSPANEGDKATVTCYVDEDLKDDANHFVRFSVQIFPTPKKSSFRLPISIFTLIVPFLIKLL